MTSVRRLAVVLTGLFFVGFGTLLGAVSRSPSDDSVHVAVAAVIVLVGLLVVIVKVWGTPEVAGDGPAVPWGETDTFAAPAPERTNRDPPLSSDELVAVIDDAGAAARSAGTVEDGIDVARPVLRGALIDALIQGGMARADAEATLADGSWTDDDVAASVLEADLTGPDRPFRDRLTAWLFPERVVRRRIGRATGAVAAAADEALPTVPGQTAPRTVPVVKPRLEELTRGADGRLERAADPDAIARGPRPPRLRLGDDGASTSGKKANGSTSGDATTADAPPTGADTDPSTSGDSAGRREVDGS
ncbi:DUF7269 family protein [Natrarchaeobius chitinivorans]|uniref:Uncharacterized protein n=1 Tax=Natrarchaeobius chitinivorans TaxID=1679083 RepID=A0A3N6LU30_NATCH|nr:hypothetical protein [Natrarchaeobius chitinivorans]RQG92117.1 hypothetical protein EA473_17845 [Natrarchaeobius chitinivorans]